MNPDAILGSEVYLKYKTEVMDSMKNAFSASPGIMSGNTFAAMTDRLGKDALTVQQNYIASLNVGYQGAMQRVGLGKGAQEFISNLNQARGVNLANLTTGAYNQLGMNERDLGTALANLSTSEGAGLANLKTGRGTALANLGVGRTQDLANLDLGLATQLANIQLASMQENPWTNLGTTAITAGTDIIKSKEAGKTVDTSGGQNLALAGRQPIASTGGTLTGAFDPSKIPGWGNPFSTSSTYQR